MKTQHLVVTRYNLGVYSGQRIKGWRGSRDRWMNSRLALFAAYCAPSVAAQINQDFDWLLLFDPKTPAERVDAVVRAAGRERLQIVCADRPHRYPERQQAIAAVRRAVLPMVNTTADRLITTRLDNDDMIHESLLALVRDLADRTPTPERYFVDPVPGYFVRPHDGRYSVVTRRRFSSGTTPFASLVETLLPNREPTTVWAAAHARLQQHAPVKLIEGMLLWAHICHDGNVTARRLRGESTAPEGPAKDAPPVVEQMFLPEGFHCADGGFFNPRIGRPQNMAHKKGGARVRRRRRARQRRRARRQ